MPKLRPSSTASLNSNRIEPFALRIAPTLNDSMSSTARQQSQRGDMRQHSGSLRLHHCQISDLTWHQTAQSLLKTRSCE